jgi:hypothetical protein
MQQTFYAKRINDRNSRLTCAQEVFGLINADFAYPLSLP